MRVWLENAYAVLGEFFGDKSAETEPTAVLSL